MLLYRTAGSEILKGHRSTWGADSAKVDGGRLPGWIGRAHDVRLRQGLTCAPVMRPWGNGLIQLAAA